MPKYCEKCPKCGQKTAVTHISKGIWYLSSDPLKKTKLKLNDHTHDMGDIRQHDYFVSYDKKR